MHKYIKQIPSITLCDTPNVLRNISIVLCCFISITVHGQKANTNISLFKAITLAQSESIEAFRIQNMYLTNYWRYRTYKAARLPILSSKLVPIQYRNAFTQQYDYDNNTYVFRAQQTLQSSANLSLSQNLDLTGGTFFIDSELGMLRTYGINNFEQYTSVPLRIGYNQQLFGLNTYKWERKVEPLLFEKAKKELIENTEQIACNVVAYYFAVVRAQSQLDIALQNKNRGDTLYNIGIERHKIAAISKADLLTLQLDVVNARNTVSNALVDVERSRINLVAYLAVDKDDQKIDIILPSNLPSLTIDPEHAIQLARNNNPQYLDNASRIALAEQEAEKTKKESRFNANLSFSVGFNQTANQLHQAYNDPIRQDLAQIAITIPIIDWGVRKGKHNMAQNNLNVSKLTAQQNEIKLEQEVRITVSEFNIQADLVVSAKEALDIAILAYSETKERFLIGKTDVNGLGLAQNRQNVAQQSYILALQNYWLLFYKLRRICLFDFVSKTPIELGITD